MSARRSLLALPLLFAAPLPLYAQAVAAPAAKPAPVAELVKQVDIPYEQFTLPNGLRVVVHTDRKAPVVAVSMWYHIGSKDEPKGRTGFAHLFEHLMFYRSENQLGSYLEQFERLGATDFNGTTWYDRTNYFETVPTAALETALFYESDRMGHLLGAIDQAKLDAQRGVVQNEKRQGDNQPFGLVDYYVSDALLPEGHPYRHSTIGTMGDLNAATLTTVHDWFRRHYGPNNAVVVLAGDIDVAKAKALTATYFGSIPRGPAVEHPAVTVPALAAPKTLVLKDRVPYTQLQRVWAVEGVNGKDTTALEAAASVLGGLSSSRLDNALVRGDSSAVRVSSGVQAFEGLGFFNVEVNVKPGVDAVAVGRKLDALLADFIRNGPTADEVQRVATRKVAATIAGYESVGGFGGKATALAEGLVYSGDPGKYKKELDELAGLTPARIKAAMAKWLTRPVLNLVVEPGARDESAAAKAITGDSAASAPVKGDPVTPPVRVARTEPAVGSFPPLAFPAIERGKLANGIPVYFARRTDVPAVRVSVAFDAGSSADPAGAAGLQSLTMSLLDEGTTTLNSTQIAEAQERLGATLSSSGGQDRSNVGLYALKANLAPSLDLLADVVKNPAFDPKEVERLRGQQLAAIAASLSQPQGIASFVLPGKLFGEGHPYGHVQSGTPASVKAITRDQITGFQRDWLRPDNAAIYVVGDTSLAEITPLLDARFGSWTGARSARLVKTFGAVPAPAATRIYLVDRPQSPQSVILAGQVLAAKGADDALVTLQQSNDVIGGSTTARLSLDLREKKNWSYGSYTSVRMPDDRASVVAIAPVQSDKTGESVAAVLGDIKEWLTATPTTRAERDRVIDSSIRGLPGDFETSDAVLGGLVNIITRKRPDDFYQTLGARYTKLTAADLDAAARAAIDPSKFVVIVVGDAASVKPQLDKLGIPVEQVQLPASK